MPSCVLLLPGDLITPTGGYRYDRRIVAGLRDRGWQVEVLQLDDSFPLPTTAALVHAEAAVAALPDASLVLADGLAFGALPDIAQRHAQRLKWVALVHHPLWLETGLDTACQAALIDSERRACAAARRVVVTSDATARLLQELDVPAARIAVIEPGSESMLTAALPHATETPPAGRAGAVSPAGLRLLCVATLTPRKGHLVLLEALAGLRDRAWTLHCVGSLSRDAATVQAVRDALIRHGLQDRVHLHGAVDEAALEQEYADADAVIVPSHFEGYGMVVAEALARGLPVVSTATGAANHLLADNAAALVAPGDANALRHALARLIDEPPWRAQLAASARAAQARLPTWPVACERWAALLVAVAAESPSESAA